MRRVVWLLVSLGFLSCATVKNYLEPGEGEAVYSHSVSIDQANIRSRLLVFVNEKYHSGKAVVQTDDPGLFIGNGRIYLQDVGVLGNTADMEMTFIVKYQDRSYSVKWIVKEIIHDGGMSYTENYWGMFKDSIKQKFKENDDELFAYLSKDSTSF